MSRCGPPPLLLLLPCLLPRLLQWTRLHALRAKDCGLPHASCPLRHLRYLGGIYPPACSAATMGWLQVFKADAHYVGSKIDIYALKERPEFKVGTLTGRPCARPFSGWLHAAAAAAAAAVGWCWPWQLLAEPWLAATGGSWAGCPAAPTCSVGGLFWGPHAPSTTDPRMQGHYKRVHKGAVVLALSSRRISDECEMQVGRSGSPLLS